MGKLQYTKAIITCPCGRKIRHEHIRPSHFGICNGCGRVLRAVGDEVHAYSIEEYLKVAHNPHDLSAVLEGWADWAADAHFRTYQDSCFRRAAQLLEGMRCPFCELPAGQLHQRRIGVSASNAVDAWHRDECRLVYITPEAWPNQVVIVHHRCEKMFMVAATTADLSIKTSLYLDLSAVVESGSDGARQVQLLRNEVDNFLAARQQWLAQQSYKKTSQCMAARGEHG